MTEDLPGTAGDTDLRITRFFAAPRAISWRFWTEPERLAQWFGPSAFHVPADTVTIEPRVGGRWDLSMVDNASVKAYPISGRITAINEPGYLEIVLSAQTEVGQLEGVTLRVTFQDHADSTEVTLHQGPFTAEERDMTAGGWELSFVKLDAILRTVSG